ncbi:phage major capsid protein [Microbacterium paludicola]|uniref:phage major capsid protein n=1 Tax=Microbacterium paludicola TaxID=300019 RepID=UPI0031DEA89B
MNPKEKLAQLQKRLGEIAEKAKAESRDFTPSEITEIEAGYTEALDLKGKIERSEKSQALLASIGGTVISEPAGGSGSGVYGAAKSYLALTGARAKHAGATLANQIRSHHGAKAFVTPGAEVFATPLESQSPLEIQRIPTSLLEVLKSTQRGTPRWEYLRQTAFTNNAAIVAPGAEKPTSVITLDKETGELQVIAHLTEPVDKFLLEDNDTLVSFITSQMLYGIARKLEAEVLAGDGTAGHLTGLLNTTGTQAQTAGADPITTLRLAATQLEVLGYSADVFILNPNDWAGIETARATSGSFDLGGPIDRAARKVWGSQVITSTGVPAGTALALDLDAATIDHDTRGVQVEWDRSQGFKTNELIARVEGRFGLSVYRPDAIVEIDLAA